MRRNRVQVVVAVAWEPVTSAAADDDVCSQGCPGAVSTAGKCAKEGAVREAVEK